VQRGGFTISEVCSHSTRVDMRLVTDVKTCKAVKKERYMTWPAFCKVSCIACSGFTSACVQAATPMHTLDCHDDRMHKCMSPAIGLTAIPLAAQRSKTLRSPYPKLTAWSYQEPHPASSLAPGQSLLQRCSHTLQSLRIRCLVWQATERASATALLPM
jgi:hypothetical protein